MDGGKRLMRIWMIIPVLVRICGGGEEVGERR